MADGRYFIQPGFDVGQGLAGLGQAAMQAQQYRAQRQAQQQAQQRAFALDSIYKGLANPEEIPALAQAMGVPQLAQAYQADAPGTIEKMKRLAAGLDPVRYQNYVKGFGKLPGQSGRATHQKTGAFLMRDAQGNTKIVVGDYNTETGEITSKSTDLSGLTLVSKLGETGAEETTRKVEQTKQEAQVKNEEARFNELVNQGTTAAESTANIRRAIDLLGRVKTGGFRNIALRAKQAFGVEGADEGELSTNLGKAVLSQLRTTFGAAFTEREGARLERIESGFGKSTETNLRLLNQALKFAEKKANRAMRAAEKRGDLDTVEEIKDLLAFTFTDEPTHTPTPAPGQPGPQTESDYNDMFK